MWDDLLYKERWGKPCSAANQSVQWCLLKCATALKLFNNLRTANDSYTSLANQNSFVRRVLKYGKPMPQEYSYNEPTRDLPLKIFEAL